MHDTQLPFARLTASTLVSLRITIVVDVTLQLGLGLYNTIFIWTNNQLQDNIALVDIIQVHKINLAVTRTRIRIITERIGERP